ncbi:MAG: hypothetical protein WBE74_25375 [Terracidiphilus sp.]
MPQESAQNGLSEAAASGLAYLTFIPAIIFLVVAPYNQNSTVRFHAWQSIFLSISWAVVWIVLLVIGVIPVFNFILLVITPIAAIGFFILWVFVLVQAFLGKRLKIPLVGDFALRQASSSGL